MPLYLITFTGLPGTGTQDYHSKKPQQDTFQKTDELFSGMPNVFGIFHFNCRF